MMIKAYIRKTSSYVHAVRCAMTVLICLRIWRFVGIFTTELLRLHADWVNERCLCVCVCVRGMIGIIIIYAGTGAHKLHNFKHLARCLICVNCVHQQPSVNLHQVGQTIAFVVRRTRLRVAMTDCDLCTYKKRVFIDETVFFMLLDKLFL